MIRAVLLTEIALMVAVVVFIVTQLLIPALRGLPLFPVLRKKRQEALEAVVAAREEQEVSEILRRIPTNMRPKSEPEVFSKPAPRRRSK